MFVIGCVGYDRPTERNLNAIGAPSVTVGPSGLDSPAPWGLQPERKATNELVGQATNIRPDGFSLKTQGGKTLEVRIDHRTLIDQDGRHVGWSAVPEGASVRTGIAYTGKGPVAVDIDVVRD